MTKPHAMSHGGSESPPSPLFAFAAGREEGRGMWNYFRGESASNRSAFALPPLSPIEQEKGYRARSQVATSPMVFVAQSQVESELAAHSLARSARDVRTSSGGRPMQSPCTHGLVVGRSARLPCMAFKGTASSARIFRRANVLTYSFTGLNVARLPRPLHVRRERECEKVWRRCVGDRGESAGNPKRTPRLTVALSSAAAQALS